MTAKQKIDKILEVTELEINDFAIKCGIIPNSLKAAIKRDALTDAIVTKIHNKIGVRKGFFKDGKEPVIEKNLTLVQEGSDNTQKPLGAQEMLKVLQDTLAEGSDYRIIPNRVLEGNYLEIENRAKELDARAKELAYIKVLQEETITTKNQYIQHLEKEIADLRSRPIASQGAQ